MAAGVEDEAIIPARRAMKFEAVILREKENY
jgi:hypothetical protein